MNAGGMFKACKSNAPFGGSGKRVSNTLVIYPKDRNNPRKLGLIPDVLIFLKLDK